MNLVPFYFEKKLEKYQIENETEEGNGRLDVLGCGEEKAKA
jgi:hypothetical protein